MQIAPLFNIHDYGDTINFDADRITLELDENETASHIPKLFLKQVPPPATNLHLPVSELRIIQYIANTEAEAIAQFEIEIKDHVETKIQLFFYQLLLVNGLGLKFFQEKALYQAGLKSASAQGALPPDFKAVEAHCSTLVTVLACDRVTHQNCFELDDKPIERIFFGNNTFYSRSWNMTITLPSCVNIMDSNFEWQHKSKKYVNKTFRQCCIKLLNNVSKGKINPLVGLRQYLIKGNQYLTDIKNSQKVLAYKERINDIYLEVFSKYWDLVTGAKAFNTFKALTFTVMSDGEVNFQLAHDFMIGRLQEEISMQRKLIGLTQRIQQLCNIPNNTKELRLLTKGVAMERTSSDIARWFEEFIARNNHQLTATSGAYVKKCLNNHDFIA